MHPRLKFALTAAVAALAACGCANTRAMRAKLLKMARNPVAEAEYRIAPPDQVMIEVKGYPEYSRSATVRPDGKVTVVSVGDIYVQGLTLPEATEAVRNALLKELEQPVVTLMLLAANSKAVYVMGEVRRPGTQMYYGDMTLVDAIGTAGGVTLNADVGVVTVTRPGLEKSEILTVNLRKLVYDGAAEHNVVLKEGDIIHVPPTGFAKVGYAMNQLLFPFRAILSGLVTYGGVEQAVDGD